MQLLRLLLLLLLPYIFGQLLMYLSELSCSLEQQQLREL